MLDFFLLKDWYSKVCVLCIKYHSIQVHYFFKESLNECSITSNLCTRILSGIF